MRYYYSGSEVGVCDGSGDYLGPVVADCWVALDSRGLWLQWSRGDGFTESKKLAPSDLVGGMECAGIDEIDEIDEDGTDITSEIRVIYDMFSCVPGRRYEWFDAIVRAEAVPFVDAADVAGPFAEHNFRCFENMLHDPNFHSSLAGASRREKEQIAGDICGVPFDFVR